MKKKEKAKELRVLGRRLAEEVPKQELDRVRGGKVSRIPGTAIAADTDFVS